MERTKKHAFVDDLSGKLAGASFVYVTDFAGLDVERLTLLRSRLRAASVEYVVVKNTLARRAIEGTAAAALAELLEGPNAFAMSEGDAVAAAKVLTDFAREGDLPKIKGGVVAGRIVSLEEIRRLATLPPRQVLLAQLASGLKSPVSGLVYVLAGVLSKFVRTVDALRARRAEAGDEPAASGAAPSSAASGAVPATADESPAAAGASVDESAIPETVSAGESAPAESVPAESRAAVEVPAQESSSDEPLAAPPAEEGAAT